MPKQIEFDGVVHEFPDDFTDADIAAALGGGGSAPEPSAPAGGMLPTAGSFIGSLAGTIGGIPGRIAGAGVGGALGKGAELFMDEKDDSFTDSLKAMGTEGAKQAGLEAAGGMVGRGLKAIAPKMADVALSPIESLARKYPNIGKTYVREGKLFSRIRGGVGAVGKKSSATQAATLRTESRKSGDAMLEAADAAGAPKIQTRRTLSELRPIMREAATDVRTGKADARPEMVARVKAYTTRTPDASLSEANVLRRRLDDTADKAFTAARSGQAVNTSEATVDKALAGGLRRRIKEGAAAAGQKNYAATTERTRDLAGLTKALDKAATRKHLLTRTLGISTGVAGSAAGAAGSGGDPGATIGGGLGTLGATYMLTNPRNLGRMALASHGAGQVAEATPQMLRAALLALMLANGEGEDK